jgi:hypothetical protein
MDERLNRWEVLFQRALILIDSAREIGITVDGWTFGGGTVLMRRHQHRFSKDVDIFIDDPQCNILKTTTTSNWFSPKVKSIVAAPPLTPNPAHVETLFEHQILVETSAEIVAKKVWHRGFEFTARDIFDLAMVAELEPQATDAFGREN